MGFNQEFTFGTVPVSKSEIDLSKANANELGWAGEGQYTLTANPYHMMVLMGAIANGGEYVQPRLTNDLNLFGSLGKDNRTLVSAF